MERLGEARLENRRKRRKSGKSRSGNNPGTKKARKSRHDALAVSELRLPSPELLVIASSESCDYLLHCPSVALKSK